MSSDTTTGAYWLGLSDQTQEGKWIWQKSFVDAATTFTNWTSENPHVDRTMNCAHIELPDWYDGSWSDINCNHDNFIGWGIKAICETENTAKLY